MIGNDIVDLKRISSNWKRPGFLDKVFTSEEQQLILRSKDQQQTVWRLWSMKEAAYKSYMQPNGVRFFNPQRIKCQISNELLGIVSIENMYFYTSSTISEDYIHTIATLKNTDPETIRIYQTTDSSHKNQSTFLKDKLLECLSSKIGASKMELSIKKRDNGTPVVFYNSDELNMPFSLSHCGRFSSYTIC